MAMQAHEIEALIRDNKYHIAVSEIQEYLCAHINESGGKYTSVEEALLILGVFSGHYIRYSEIIAKSESGELTLTDALFCLFFLTDVELRMQAAGLKQ